MPTPRLPVALSLILPLLPLAALAAPAPAEKTATIPDPGQKGLSPGPSTAPSAANPATVAPSDVGYYRQPSLRGDTVVFVSEGDLWRASVPAATAWQQITPAGKVGESAHATRLTSHPGAESSPQISPDGQWVAFVGTYEGPAAAYVMPISGGRPTRLTWDGIRVNVVGWSPDGKVLVATDAFSTLPAAQLTRIDPKSGARDVVPLAQASDGAYTANGQLIFTRLAFQGSQTARYQGGTAQNLWRWDPAHPDTEANALTGDYAGTSKNPMTDAGKIYFLSDRPGLGGDRTMNVWAMAEDGTGLTQLTKSRGWDIISATLDPARAAATDGGSGHGTRIAYRVGADLHVLDVASGKDDLLALTLDSDLDQTREQWIPDPEEWISNIDLSPDGEKLAITARGRVWVIPKTHGGRVVSLTNEGGVRWRSAQFSPDGKTVLGFSDASGEVELAEVPADGSAPPTILTHDSDVLRWALATSPDGKLIAHTDKDQRLWLYSRATGKSTLVTSSTVDLLTNPTFSQDSKMLAWQEMQETQLHQIHLENLATGVQSAITTARYDSYDPAFSPDGKWLYFLSDRNFTSTVPAPWGTYGPEPYFDHRTSIYALALQPGTISPFQPYDELHPKPADDEGDDDKPASKKDAKAAKKAAKLEAKEEAKEAKKGEPPSDLPAIVTDGLADRIWPVPVAPGDISDLSVSDSAIYWVESDPNAAPGAEADEPAPSTLKGLAIGNDPPEVKALATGIESYQLSRDGKHLFLDKDDAFNIVDAGVDELDLSKAAVDLSGWSFSIDPREEWRQMFVESWRLERDYFYATNMNGADWKGMLDRYLPLVDRVRSRAELSDLISQMVSQLSTLHTFVYGGDARTGPDMIATASLGASFSPAAGGLRVDHIDESDPDQPSRRSPLQMPGIDVREGDVLLTIDHAPVASVPELEEKLRTKAGHAVLIGYQRPGVDGKKATTMQALVTPVDPGGDRDLRYRDWEMSRRDRVEKTGGGTIGYVHLRAMGAEDIAEWVREYYPVFNRDGLIIDVRNNRGGNIDSWILDQLLRRPWMYWSQRVGASASWNMQSAFRGPIAVLCDSGTSSDGEAFSEGIKRLGIGKLIGTRTWGGEVWLSGDNFLVDGGIATAAEFGVYGPEGKWLIEGRGVEPDMVVDNLPHATYAGADAQLDAALKYLQDELKAHPVAPVPHPAWPDQSPR